MHALTLTRRALCALALLLAAQAVACSGPQENTTPDPIPQELSCGRLMVPSEDGERCAPVQTAGVESKVVMFPSQKTPGGLVSLNGVLTRPKWAPGTTPPARVPGVVLIHGSGPLGRDSLIPGDLVGPFPQPVPAFKDLAEALSARGFAVLRYDKRTCTAKADPACTYPAEIALKATWDDLRGDAAAAATFLGSQTDIDPKDLILVGHSQGATLAIELGKEVRPSALVLLAGTFEPIDKVIVRQVKWQLDAVSATLKPKELDEARKRIAEIESGLLAIRQGFFPEEEVFMGASAGFWQKWFAASEATPALLQDYRGPVLYLRGGDDHNVEQIDQDGYSELLKGKKGARVATLPDHTHAFTLRGKEGGVTPQTTTAVIEWLTGP